MVYQPTVVVLDYDDVFKHEAFQDADILYVNKEWLSSNKESNPLSKGLPTLSSVEAQKRKDVMRVDHGALVLNRLVGKECGTSPQARVIYVPSQRGEKSIDDLQKVLSHLHQKGEAVDAISVSDMMATIWAPNILKNERIGQQLSCAYFSMKQCCLESQNPKHQAVWECFKSWVSRLEKESSSLEQDVLLPSSQHILKEVQACSLEMPRSAKYGELGRSVDGLIVSPDGKLPCLADCDKQIEQARTAQKKWQHMCAECAAGVYGKGRETAVFTCDLPETYGYDLHDLDKNGKPFQTKVDMRIEGPRVSKDKVFLLPNEGIPEPDTWGRTPSGYRSASRGGLSSLVSSLAGVFLTARSIQPELTVSDFWTTLKETGRPLMNDNQQYGGYRVDSASIQATLLSNNKIRNILCKVSCGTIGQPVSDKKCFNAFKNSSSR